jgi:hypothetical protein
MRELRSSGQTKVQRTLNRSEAELGEANVPERLAICAVRVFKALSYQVAKKFV